MTDKATPDPGAHELRAGDVRQMPMPTLDYLPPTPTGPAPLIGLIGAGGIAASHLDAYRQAGWEVSWICNRSLDKAQARADEFYPGARTTADWQDVLADESVGIVDITPHPEQRLPIIEAALRAGKHVLSQKPFVLSLDDGERLVRIARDNGVHLAVNQNGRWAPHMAMMRAAVKSGLIGDVVSVHCAIHWDHGWIVGTPFEEIDDLILFDFGVHWFDFVSSLIGDRVQSVSASSAFAAGQAARVPLLAQAQVAFDGGQASLVFDGAVPVGGQDSSFVAGTHGSLRACGPDLNRQTVVLSTPDGRAEATPDGQWFNDGFRGSMGELMVSIEEGRAPLNDASRNLDSLALTFAAVEARRSGSRIEVGDVRGIRL